MSAKTERIVKTISICLIVAALLPLMGCNKSSNSNPQCYNNGFNSGLPNNYNTGFNSNICASGNMAYQCYSSSGSPVQNTLCSQQGYYCRDQQNGSTAPNQYCYQNNGYTGVNSGYGICAGECEVSSGWTQGYVTCGGPQYDNCRGYEAYCPSISSQWMMCQ